MLGQSEVPGLMAPSDLPVGFRYPYAARRLVEFGLVYFNLWRVMGALEARERMEGMASRYPGRSLVPFARREDNDDVACFEVGGGPRVLIVHDFASPGWEARGTLGSVWEWARLALDDMIEREEDDEGWFVALAGHARLALGELSGDRDGQGWVPIGRLLGKLRARRGLEGVDEADLATAAEAAGGLEVGGGRVRASPAPEGSAPTR